MGPAGAQVAEPHARVVMIGNFDGVHRGHQKLIDLTLRRARRHGAQPCALTFSPHPRRFFQGDAAPPMLTDDAERARLLQYYGIPEVVVLGFDAALANQSAAEFAGQILKRDLGAVHVVVGAGYRFGRGREGGVDDLRRMGAAHGYGVTAAALAVCANGEAFSSTRVRQALAGGDLGMSRAILGRSWSHRAVCIGDGEQARLDSGPYPRLPCGNYRVSVRRAGFATIPSVISAQIDQGGVIHLQWPLAAGHTEVLDVAWMELASTPDELQLRSA